VIAYDSAPGPVLRPGPGDVVLSAGSDWLHKGNVLVRAQRRDGFRLVVLCFDLLPAFHPEFFQPVDIAPFAAYWTAMLPVAARILCTADCVARDIQAFAAQHGLEPPPTALVKLGHPPPPYGPLPPLPGPLQAGKYALFVSTIEPRKGHATVLQAWSNLIAAGVPQRHDFRLVFVGRTGWMVDDILQ